MSTSRVGAVLCLTFIFALACAFSISSAQASVTSWTFTGDSTASSYAANVRGSDFLSATLTPSDTADESIVNNAANGNPAPELKLTGGTGMNGNTLVLALTAGGQISISTLAFDYNRSGNNAATSIAWTYAVIGGQSGSLGSTTLSGSGENAIPDINLSAIGPVGGGAVIDLTGKISGAINNTSSSVFFDDFDVTASPVPEPVAWGAISGIGLIGLCGFHAWRKRQRKRPDLAR